MTLLDVIAGREAEGFFEVSWVVPSGHGKRWFALDARDECLRFVASKSRTTDVFIGAAPRYRQKGGKDSVRRSWALWVDCDTPESAARLMDFRVPPTLVIGSGTPGNAHAWWSLDRPLTGEWIERANGRLAHLLGADVKCSERARILRPPGTLNFKHTPPRPVVVLHSTGAVYSVADVVADLPEPKGERSRAPIPKRTKYRAGDDGLLSISAREYVPRLTGRDLNARGKVACPFHGGGSERTPSLQTYVAPDRGWHCFGCGLGGSIYNFAGELWGLATRGQEFLELRERLQEVFHA